MGIDIENPNDFTEEEYIRVLELASRKYTFVHYDEKPPGPFVCWRHDVDYSPQRALAMAGIEAERSLKCIYHMYLNGRYYSIFEPPVTAIFRKIAELGHVLGLHFDMDVFGTGNTTDTDRILERIGFEKNILETLLHQPMRSISFHNFVLNQERLMRADSIHGMINVCSPEIWDGYKYVSDSNGIWRHERLRDVLSGEPYNRLHVLTHPVWWTPTPQTPMQRLKRAVEGRAQSGIDFYLSLLKRDGRFEHIADQIGLDRRKDKAEQGNDAEASVEINPLSNPVQEGDERFHFGRNWSGFARHLNRERIASSMLGIQKILQQESLKGCRFLDIGSGSGLSSLAAHILGAQVHGFDFDLDSVQTSRQVLQTCVSDSDHWNIEHGSALDERYMKSLGLFDVVYAWGVLHHTGAMWRALELAADRVRPGGKLAMAIYNDQGGASRRWRFIKRSYVKSPRLVKGLIVSGVGLFFELRAAAIRLVRFQNPLPFNDWKKRREDRGMTIFHDLVDWVGGYPFEVAKPEEIIDFLHPRGFWLRGLKTCGGGPGCNEYLFVRQKVETS